MENLLTPRDIFNQFEFTEYMSPTYHQLEQKLDKVLETNCGELSYNAYNEIDCAATSLAVEAQTMGFELGFKYAVSLLLTGGDSQ